MQTETDIRATIDSAIEGMSKYIRKYNYENGCDETFKVTAIAYRQFLGARAEFGVEKSRLEKFRELSARRGD